MKYVFRFLFCFVPIILFAQETELPAYKNPKNDVETRVKDLLARMTLEEKVDLVSGKKKNELSGKLLELAKANAPTSPDLPTPKAWPSALEKRSQEHGARRLSSLGVARQDEEGREKLRLMNFEFYGAPCAVFLFIDGSLGEWSIFDMGLFTQNLILAAHSLGVESCLQASVTAFERLPLASVTKLPPCSMKSPT